MKTRSSRTIYSYWNDRRGSRLAPERGDIDPGAIRGALSDSFILSGEPGFPFRLAGTRLCALFGRELKGTAFAELWGPADTARALAGEVAGETVGAIAGAIGTTEGGESCDLELLLLPLYHRGKAGIRLLGALAPVAVPAWIGGDHIASLQLGAVRYLGAAVTPFAPRVAPPRPDGERPVIRGRRGFVIYQGGRV